MTSTERRNLFRRALDATAAAQASAPESRVLLSIQRQLEYLIGVVSGSHPADRLDDIILGLQAVREIEGWHDELADLLHRCSAEVEAMKRERALVTVKITH